MLKGSGLKQKKATYTPNIFFFIVHELDAWSWDLNSDFTLKDCLFGGVKLPKNVCPDKYIYTGYGIRLDLRSEFSDRKLTVACVKMLLFLELIGAHLCILIIGKKIS